MSDQKLEEIVQEYSELAKDKNIDAATLMINALQQQEANRVDPKWRRWAYFLSFAFPPIGLIFAIYYFFRSESDARTTAYWCLAITIFVIVLSVIFLQVFMSSAGITPQQIQQIDPQEIYQLTQ